MKIFYSKKKLEKFIRYEKKLGFVPTMGGIHLGHISLVKKSIHECKKTIVTIFVNKQQFNNKRDYENYPRTIKKDIFLLRKAKVDFLYLPKSKEIYPDSLNKKIKISSFSKKLCGKNRPGHFESVADVLHRFIKIINPHKIYFGQKDMQQLKIMEHYIKKNFKNIKVVGCKTIREKNGLALSTRNSKLSYNNKKIAVKIYKCLINNKNTLIKNINYVKIVKKNILDIGATKIDYIKVLDCNNLIKPYKKSKKIKIFVAYYLGLTRLIDNV
jgi:pantoate--beta-alanine ligase